MCPLTDINDYLANIRLHIQQHDIQNKQLTNSEYLIKQA